MNALSLSRRRHGARLRRRRRGSAERATCASSAMRRRASREDYLRILRFFRFHAYYGEGASGRRRAACRDRGARRARTVLARARAHGADEAAARAARGAGARRDGGGGAARVACSAACRISQASPTWRRWKRRAGFAPDATRRLGALGVWVAEDAERLWQRLRLSNAEHERLAAMGDGWWRVSPAMGEAAARELIYRIGPEHFTERALLAWARAEASAHDAAWRDLATLPQRWTAPAFPLQRRGLHRARRRERARRSARRWRAPRRPGSRRAFRWTGKRSTTSRHDPKCAAVGSIMQLLRRLHGARLRRRRPAWSRRPADRRAPRRARPRA